MHVSTIAADRARALRTVELTFAAIAAVALMLAAGFHHGWLGAEFPRHDTDVVARGFLTLAALDTLLMLLWERLFPAAR